MSIDLTPFHRIDPTPGMMIGVDVWREAHDYHRLQLSRHHLALHGWGVIEGLQVTLVEGRANTLYIHPGLAIDSAGRFVVVPQPQTYQITTSERQTVYLVLQFRDVPADATGQTPWQLVEAYRIQERDRLPQEPYLELARIAFDPNAGAIRLPANPDAPDTNELDVRSRVELGRSGSGEYVAPPPPPPPSAPVVLANTDGLAPRVDSLSEQLGALDQRLQALSTELAALRAGTINTVGPSVGPGSEGANGRVEALAAELQQLAGRVESLGAPTVAEANLAPLDAMRERVDGLRHEVDALGLQLQAVGGLRHEVDALGLQLQAVSRQVDTLSAVAATPVVVPAAPTVTTVVSAERVAVRLAVAAHGAAGWDAHRDGLRLLARELTNSGGFDGQAVEPVRLADAYGVDVLYLSGHAGFSLNDAELDALRQLLEQRAAVVAEGCASGPSGESGAREFAMSVVDIANRLGRQLTRVDRGHPLLRARYVFGELPPGARATARVLESGGLVYSDADYGCAWQGGPAEHPLPRTTIRDAFEFGINLALFRRQLT